MSETTDREDRAPRDAGGAPATRSGASTAGSGTGGRVPAYDVVRIAAMAGVVAIHILAGGLAQLTTVGAARTVMLVPDRVLNDLCVPAFLFLTGALVWRPRDTHPAAWWRRRFEVVFLPYLAWSLLYLGVSWTQNGLPAGGIAGASWAAVMALVTGTAWFHLYFPPLLLIIYLLRVPAARLARRPAFLLAAALAVQALLAVVFHLVRMPQPFGLMLTNLLTLLPFAAVGAWYAVNAEVLRRRVPAVLVAGLAGAVVIGLHAAGILIVPRDPYAGLWQRAVMEAAAGVLFVAGILLLEAASDRYAAHGPALQAAAGLSYGVYLAHPLVILGLLAVLPASTAPLWSSPPFLAAVLLVVLTATLGLVRLLRVLPPTRWLV